MTVRVANDFKTEAQHELEKLVLENKSLRDKVRSLESQLDKLKGMNLNIFLSVACVKGKFDLCFLYRTILLPVNIWYLIA